ncbi:MAG: DUF2064 domain-containing protein [Mycobacteriales bacterium]
MTAAPRTTVVVMAKAPVAGQVKTRLCPPCTPGEAAAIAEAALRDTLAVVLAAPVDRRLLVLDGAPGDWLPAGFDVVAQRGRDLAQRLDHAVSCVPSGQLLIVGMDTPQLTISLLQKGFAALDGADAALGPATDGGWWALALRSPYVGLFDGVPMSAPDTRARQLDRLGAMGLRTVPLPELTDVDRFCDAQDVAASIPGSAFARAVGAVGVGQIVTVLK